MNHVSTLSVRLQGVLLRHSIVLDIAIIIQRKFAALCSSRFALVIINMKLIRPNLPTLKTRRRFLGSVFLITVVRNKLRCYTFTILYVYLRGVSAANAVCRHGCIPVFNRKFISLASLVKSVNNTGITYEACCSDLFIYVV